MFAIASLVGADSPGIGGIFINILNGVGSSHVGWNRQGEIYKRPQAFDGIGIGNN